MIIGYRTMAASAAAMMLTGGAGAAQAQGYYAPGELPPPPYVYVGDTYGGGYGCGGDRFTLVGARAGVTVLGIDLGASAGLTVPTDGACVASTPVFRPRPYAPPPVAYGYPAYEQTYAPPPPPVVYGYPCGCQAPPRW